MRKLLVGIALVGVTASVALLTRAQLRDTNDDAPGVSGGASAPANVGEDVRVAEDRPLEPLAAPSASPSQGNTSGQEPVRPQQPATEPKPYIRDVPTIAAEDEDGQTKGATVLKAAAAAYSNVSTLQAGFTQKRENPLLGSTTNSRGTLYQKRPDRFLMKFSQPAGDIILSDGRYFWVYYPSADRRQVIRADATQGAAGGVDLQAQFLGDPLKRFTHTYHGVENGLHVLTMVPRTNMGYKSLKVWIDAKDSLVRRFVLTENNGVVVEIALSGLVVNRPLSNDLFTFTPPADAQVITQ